MKYLDNVYVKVVFLENIVINVFLHILILPSLDANFVIVMLLELFKAKNAIMWPVNANAIQMLKELAVNVVCLVFLIFHLAKAARYVSKNVYKTNIIFRLAIVIPSAHLVMTVMLLLGSAIVKKALQVWNVINVKQIIGVLMILVVKNVKFVQHQAKFVIKLRVNVFVHQIR